MGSFGRDGCEIRRDSRVNVSRRYLWYTRFREDGRETLQQTTHKEHATRERETLDNVAVAYELTSSKLGLWLARPLPQRRL